ncbi:unnamed protein product [Spirodela intermedia]|uniref:Uncharacterized protein n=1 Tax=Spirodela intermedia TaxID=51605 RepID=A0A7I8I907_SPIIN|nr:unnamed protein product [Spirodela intermedia]CAA6654145.1 unnamed protein product [Spirodela intermedia]
MIYPVMQSINPKYQLIIHDTI